MVKSEMEFAIIKKEQGFFIAVDETKVNAIVESLMKKIEFHRQYSNIEDFWELYTEEEAQLLFATIVAEDIEYTCTGWQDY